MITQKQENTSQIKAVGALVCHKLRKSQTLAFAANSPDTVLQVSYKAMEWLHMLRSVVQHRQQTKQTKKKKNMNYADVFELGGTIVCKDLYIYAYINLDGRFICPLTTVHGAI